MSEYFFAAFAGLFAALAVASWMTRTVVFFTPGPESVWLNGGLAAALLYVLFSQNTQPTLPLLGTFAFCTLVVASFATWQIRSSSASAAADLADLARLEWEWSEIQAGRPPPERP